MDQTEISEIGEFYNGRSVLVTGATGCLGKGLVEKLLRSCPKIKVVYVLIRSKIGQSQQSKFQSIFQSPLFDLVKLQNADALKKVQFVSGDMEKDNLGLSSEDRELICKNVSVIFHSAASIKLNEALKTAKNVNYNGTKRVLELAKQLFSLAAFVHISTAYSNVDLPEIPEMVIKQEKRLLDDLESLDDETVERLTPIMLGKKATTYTYTKACTEVMLEDECASIPICIIRPSMICSVWKEPIPGFVDCLTGPTGFIAAVCKGLLVSMNCHKEKIVDIIPLDVVVNLTLVSAFKIHQKRSEGVLVYNCCSGSINPITYSDLRKTCQTAFKVYSSKDALRPANVWFVSSAWLNFVLNLVFIVIPLFVMDCFSQLGNKKPIMLKNQRKLEVIFATYNTVLTNEWKFHSENITLLQAEMNAVDQEIFYMDVSKLNWEDYLFEYTLGIKKWILKENLEHIPPVNNKMRRLYWKNICMSIFMFVMLFWISYIE